MTNPTSRRIALYFSLLTSGAACDGQQYVSPDTINLSVTRDGVPSQLRVDRCNYVPVLLGSQVQRRYTVEDSLKVTLTATRSGVRLTFEGDWDDTSEIAVPIDILQDGYAETFVRDAEQQTYTLSLATGCTPDEVF